MSKQLVYNPTVQVLIATQNHGIVDVSSDIVSFQLDRVINGLSTFNVTLNNSKKKYTIGGKNNEPMVNTLDRIIVNMARFNDLKQVFAGYVTLAPVLTVLPNAIQITAKCTLKRLQNTFWDSSIPELRAILPGQLSKIENEGKYQDGGAGQGMKNLLTQVAQWDRNHIFIGKIPPGFLDVAATEYSKTSQTLNSALLSNLISAVDGFGTNDNNNQNNKGNKDNGDHAGANTNYQWALTVLAELQVPTTQNNMENMVRWMAAEKPPEAWWGPGKREDNIDWRNNPLNTTLNVGMYRDFANLAVAATNTAKTIEQDNMSAIKKALKHNASLAEFSKAVSNSPWDAGHYNNDPNYIASIPLPKAVEIPNYHKSFSQIVNKVLASARSQIGVPYVYGGTTPKGNGGAGEFDCSGLIQWSYAQHDIQIPRTSQEMWHSQTTGPQYTSGSPLPGDILFWNDKNDPTHVTLCTQAPDADGNAVQIEAQQTGTFIKEGGTNVSFTNNVAFVGYKRPWALVGTADSGNSAQDSTNSSSDPTTNQMDLFNTIFVAPQFNPVARMTYGSPRGFIFDEPVLNSVAQMATASFRQFMSTGTGDFIAWFPDYFGLYGTKAALKIHNIEITDLNIYHNDDALTTHVAVAGDTNGIGQSITPADWLTTTGIISVQTENVMNAIFAGDSKQAPFNFNSAKFMNKYGMRPYVTTQPLIRSHMIEFTFALMTFMEMWAEQYSTTVGLTFMPELMPGMRVQFPGIKVHGAPLECYVQGVVHEGSMAGGFTTRATLTAPSAGKKLIHYGYN